MRLERDDLAQICTGDRGLTHEMRITLLTDIAAGAKPRRKEETGVASLEFEALPDLVTGEHGLTYRVHRNGGG
ncbi:hypothetical protein LAB1_39580 [Roseibium sp. LAB1]